MHPSSFLFGVGLFAQSQQPLANSVQVGEGVCTDYNVNVDVQRTAEVEFVGQDYSVQVLYALAEKKLLVSNSYTISTRVCIPNNIETSEHADTIQLLVHGATFNKNMWDVKYEPEKYSWIQHMMKEGYPTIGIDLVGNGNSTFPDGLLEAHTQAYVEVTRQIIEKLRAGEIGGKAWKKIVLVGFSIGGIVANSIAQQYPEALDGVVLHGISWSFSWIYPAFLAGLQGPAAQIDPDKWGHLHPFYQTQTTIQGRRAATFSGKYDEALVEYDWNTRDFDSLGAAITFVHHLVTAPEFKGPAFFGIGKEDSTFCGGRTCGIGPYDVYNRFPKASDHAVHIYPETGHLVLYHHAAKELMIDTVSFLNKNGF